MLGNWGTIHVSGLIESPYTAAAQSPIPLAAAVIYWISKEQKAKLGSQGED